jgi:acyl-CoA reductase-like NAD-dependent aldehyde dehydrogenase
LIGKNLRSKEEELCSLIRAELHCSDVWATINVADTIGLVEHVASLSSSPVLSSVSPKIKTPGSLSLITQAPLGVIIGIAPWNAPAILGMRAVAAAVMAGNSAILKVCVTPTNRDTPGHAFFYLMS